MSDGPPAELTTYQKARIEKNRQQALLLRSVRLSSHPYKDNRVSTKHTQRPIDSGGGFLLEGDDDEEEFTAGDLVEDPAPILDGNKDTCIDCRKKFSDSKLLKQFGVKICDGCKEKSEHTLVTRTEAKQKYCLKDCDLDLREPLLKFIVKKNPHNERWGDMKLYYEGNVRDRSMVVWGSVEKLEEQKEKLEDNNDKKKLKKFEKRVKEMRQAVRTSTWHKDLSKHIHEYDSENETYDEEEDMYTKKCKMCDHVVTYEKM